LFIFGSVDISENSKKKLKDKNKKKLKKQNPKETLVKVLTDSLNVIVLDSYLK
jgi:hypothetical protein